MVQVRLDFISGASYPVSVYIADVYGNNKSLLGTINPGPVPPQISYNSSIPSKIMLILEDSVGCSLFKILDCTFGCAFNISVNLVDCIVNISIQDVSCDFNVLTSDESCAMVVEI